MYPDERHEYIAALEAWYNLPLPKRIKLPSRTPTSGDSNE